MNIKKVFNRRKKLNKKGEALIQIEIYHKAKRRYISTGIYIKPENWNEKKQIVVKHIYQSLYNARMNKKVLDLNNLYFENPDKFSLENLESTAIILAKFIHDSLINANTQALYNYRLFLEKENISYLKSIIDIDNLFNFLMNKKKKTGTINIYFSAIKAAYKAAYKRDLTANIFDKYDRKVKSSPLKIIYLKKDQIQALETLDRKLLTTSEIEVLDLFLFSCFTGLRYSDVVTVTESDLLYPENIIYLRKTPIKTRKIGTVVNLPISMLFDGKALEILKRKNYSLKPIESYNFHSRLIKRVAKKAKITNIDLTFHVARHTFGTSLAQKLGDFSVIIKLMGIDLKTANRYIHTAGVDIIDKLKNVKW